MPIFEVSFGLPVRCEMAVERMKKKNNPTSEEQQNSLTLNIMTLNIVPRCPELAIMNLVYHLNECQKRI